VAGVEPARERFQSLGAGAGFDGQQAGGGDPVGRLCRAVTRQAARFI